MTSSGQVSNRQLRIDAEFAAGLDQAVNDCTGLAEVGTAEEEEVLFADSGGPNGILNEVVADFESAVFEVKLERARGCSGSLCRSCFWAAVGSARFRG